MYDGQDGGQPLIIAMNVSERVRRNALYSPDAIAYASAHGETVTYEELERTIDALARRLLTLGLRPGATAIVDVADLYRYLALALALARIGVAHGPSMMPAARVEAAFVDAKGVVPEGVRAVRLDALWPRSREAIGAPMPIHDEPHSVFKICPSSGTTGESKFVPVTHELAMRRMDPRLAHDHASGNRREMTGTRQACIIKPAAAYGLLSCLLVLHGGGTVLEPSLEADEIPLWLVRSRVNRMILSPLALAKFVEVLPALRAANALEDVEVGGATLSARLLALAQHRLAPRVSVNYGSTECGRVAGALADVVARHPGAAGYAYPGVELRVVDEADRPLPAGTEGILAIRSPHNAERYVGSDELSAPVFRNGWVYPGDRAVLGADGLLIIAGRVDDVINDGGEKVNPQVLEEAMMALGGVREVAVFGVVNGVGETRVCAAIVPDVPLNANAYLARCRQHLGARAPVFVMHMESLPRNANGKVLRTELARIALRAAGG